MQIAYHSLFSIKRLFSCSNFIRICSVGYRRKYIFSNWYYARPRGWYINYTLTSPQCIVVSAGPLDSMTYSYFELLLYFGFCYNNKCTVEQIKIAKARTVTWTLAAMELLKQYFKSVSMNFDLAKKA